MLYPKAMGIPGKERLMKTPIGEKATITVQEAVEHFNLRRRKFYDLLHQPGLDFVVFYYDERRLIIREAFERYLDVHPELIRRRR